MRKSLTTIFRNSSQALAGSEAKLQLHIIPENGISSIFPIGVGRSPNTWRRFFPRKTALACFVRFTVIGKML
jgi:hypothetical protein